MIKGIIVGILIWQLLCTVLSITGERDVFITGGLWFWMLIIMRYTYVKFSRIFKDDADVPEETQEENIYQDESSDNSGLTQGEINSMLDNEESLNVGFQDDESSTLPSDYKLPEVDGLFNSLMAEDEIVNAD